MLVSWNPNVCHTMERSNCMNEKLRNKKFYEQRYLCCWGREEFNFNVCTSCLKKKKQNNFQSKKRLFFRSFLKSFLPALSWETPLGLAAWAVQEATRPVLSVLPGVSLLSPIILSWATFFLGQLPLKWVIEVDSAGILSYTWTWFWSSISIHVWQLLFYCNTRILFWQVFHF